MRKSTSSLIEMRQFYHPKYSLCTTLLLKLDESEYSNVQSMQILLALPTTQFDSVGQGARIKARRGFPLEGLSTHSGFVLVLHDADVYPKQLVQNRGVSVGAGGLTSVRFNAERFQYVDCLQDARIDQGRVGSFRHTVAHCTEAFRERTLNSRHNCTDDPFAFPWKRACLRLPAGGGSADTIRRVRNYVSVLRDVASSSELARQCGWPSCSDTSYPTSTLFSPWSINDFQWMWQMQLYVEPAAGLLQYLREADNDTWIASPAYNFSDFQSTLSTVLIYRDSMYTSVNEEVRLTSFANLWSSVGGAMSLYAGVTFTLFAEFLDFLFCVATGCVRRGTATTVSAFDGK